MESWAGPGDEAGYETKIKQGEEVAVETTTPPGSRRDMSLFSSLDYKHQLMILFEGGARLLNFMLT